MTLPSQKFGKHTDLSPHEKEFVCVWGGGGGLETLLVFTLSHNPVQYRSFHAKFLSPLFHEQSVADPKVYAKPPPPAPLFSTHKLFSKIAFFRRCQH